MNLIKGIICRLFHKIEYRDYLFYDSIGGIKVNRFECLDCKKTFMANRKTDIFRVYDSE